jgi:hypothetical protein
MTAEPNNREAEAPCSLDKCWYPAKCARAGQCLSEAPNLSLTARDALTKAAEAFRMYEKSHQAKVDEMPDILSRDERREWESRVAKATRNGLLAEQMEAALSTLVGAKTYEMGVEDMRDIAVKVADEVGSRGSNEHFNAACRLLATKIRTLTPTNPGGTHEG